MLGVIDFFVSTVLRGRANHKQAKKDAALRAEGVLAPAIVVSASSHAKRSSVDGYFIRIDYVVDVYPDAADPFRAEFQHWSDRSGYTLVRNELVGEAGKHIWVTYHPDDPSRMLYEYTEEERLEREAEAELDERRRVFNESQWAIIDVREHGERATAVVVEAEDLQLPYPARNSRALMLHVDVMPAGAPVHRATIPVLLMVPNLPKYAAGRQVHVLFDRADPRRVMLDAERNRSLPG